ncbi:hypothetical protein J1605_018152 [Eschrichtius robustus]|uniref:Uncharacterized protein n=1 Tax=Eschrichtius robustus TaxID=9764 RepID=A0AB34HYI4_ESCRO|nr:hypothetical protein J1605_018152 [Eschrichtius robustus]
MARGPGCSAACGIFPDQGSNPCPLHWQAESQPLRHQGSPASNVLVHHVGSSQTRARTHVPFIGRWILNHCTTREAC